MDRPEIEATVVECLSAVFPEIPQAELGTMTREGNADWDSVTQVTLVAVLEEAFGRRFPYEAFVGADSTPKLVTALSDLLVS